MNTLKGDSMGNIQDISEEEKEKRDREKKQERKRRNFMKEIKETIFDDVIEIRDDMNVLAATVSTKGSQSAALNAGAYKCVDLSNCDVLSMQGPVLLQENVEEPELMELIASQFVNGSIDTHQEKKKHLQWRNIPPPCKDEPASIVEIGNGSAEKDVIEDDDEMDSVSSENDSAAQFSDKNLLKNEAAEKLLPTLTAQQAEEHVLRLKQGLNYLVNQVISNEIEDIRRDERICQINRKISELTKTKTVEVRYKSSPFRMFNNCITKLVNDEHFFDDEDVLGALKRQNKKYKFGLNSKEEMLLAQKSHKKMMTKKKMARFQKIENKWSNILEMKVVDPASKDAELLNILNKHEKEGRMKTEEVLEKFAKFQEDEALQLKDVEGDM